MSNWDILFLNLNFEVKTIKEYSEYFEFEFREKTIKKSQ